MIRTLPALTVLVLLACDAPSFAADAILYDFSRQATLQKVGAKGVRLSLGTNENGPTLRVEAGTDNPWPSAMFLSPEGLDISKHGRLVVPVKNCGKDVLRICCRIDSRAKGAAPKSPALIRTTSIYVKGGRSAEFRIPLIPHVGHCGLSPDDFFGMRGVPFFHKQSMYLDNVLGIILFLYKQESPQVIEIGAFRLEGVPPKPEPIPAKPFPLIDEFGQFKHRDWPGKVQSIDEMRSRRDAEAKQLASLQPPASWDRFGGWKAGPRLKATGWFRTAKHDGKWYLVTPEGRLFFSLGIDCVGWGNETILDQRRHWFEGIPPDDRAHREFFRSWKPNMPKYHYFGKQTRAFNHHKFNVMRKYGKNWKEDFAATCARRLPCWGVNSIGSWSDPAIYSRQKIPYVAFVRTAGPPIEGSSGYWGKFVDVFHPEFGETLRRQLRQGSAAIGRKDPWCIGYFVDNELSWGNETSLALAALVSPVGQKAKQVFVADLQAKYKSIAALNKAWRTSYASWDAMLAGATRPDVAHAKADLEAFYEKTADTYFRTVRQALGEFAPHHLYLGCRFAWTNRIATRVAARHCDLVSFNVYTRYLAAKLPELEQVGDKPVIIGEFHFGALDRGLFHTGLVAVKDQAERAGAFTEYVSDCLAHPNIVGCHWFQFTDSPTTGRLWDGENYQIGFTDVCDTPYPELIGASRQIGETLYRIRARK